MTTDLTAAGFNFTQIWGKTGCPAGSEVRHLDGDSMNNDISNLAYGTRQENMDDMKRHGKTNRGTKNGSAMLDEKQVVTIRNLYSKGDTTHTKLGKQFGVCGNTVRNIVIGKLWSWLE